MRLKQILLILFILHNIVAKSQRSETALNLSSKNSHLILEVENDMLFDTDSYYTAGEALSFSNSKIHKTPAQIILNKICSTKDYSFTGFGIEQRIFTPYSIENPNSIENDRPYTAYFLISNYSVSINLEKKLLFSNEIAIGLMGKYAFGEEAQSFVHKIIGSSIPIGWDNQLESAFLIDYRFRVEKSFDNNWLVKHIVPFSEVRIGTLTDRIKLGLTTKFGNKTSFLNSKKSTDNKFVWAWVMELNLQGVFYDATLEGGLFNKEDPVKLAKQDIISQQYQVRTGINLYYKRLSFRYMLKLNSSNFASAVIHRYGGVNIGYLF